MIEVHIAKKEKKERLISQSKRMIAQLSIRQISDHKKHKLQWLGHRFDTVTPK